MLLCVDLRCSETGSQQRWKRWRLERLELALASFYGLCDEPSGNGQEFSTTLVQDERRHAEAIRQMTAILAERPNRCEPNRISQVLAIRTFIAYVESLAERLRTGAFTRSDPHRLLSLARDLEQSVLDGKWNESRRGLTRSFRPWSKPSSPKR